MIEDLALLSLVFSKAEHDSDIQVSGEEAIYYNIQAFGFEVKFYYYNIQVFGFEVELYYYIEVIICAPRGHGDS